MAIVVATPHRVSSSLQTVSRIPKSLRSSVQILVVDNSPDASAEEWPDDLTVICRPHPLGSAAFLECLDYLDAEWVLFLDDDGFMGETDFTELLEMANELRNSERARGHDGGLILSCMTNNTEMGWSTVRKGGLLRSSSKLANPPKPGLHSSVRSIDFAPWNGMFIESRVLTQLTEPQLKRIRSFYFGWDDYLLCHFARFNGAIVYGLKSVSVRHSRRQESKHQSWRLYYFLRNASMFFHTVGTTKSKSFIWRSAALVKLVITEYRFSNWPTQLTRLVFRGPIGDSVYGESPDVPSRSFCTVCNEESRYWFWLSHPKLELVYQYLRCNSCGLVERVCWSRKDGDIPVDEIYGEEYPPFQVGAQHRLFYRLRHLRDYGYFEPSLLRIALRTAFPDELMHSVAIHSDQQARILDAGCGGGEVVKRLREMGFGGAIGIDPYAPRSENEDWLFRGNLDRALELFGVAAFDVVILNHVWEHLQDQIDSVNRVAALLRDGGIVIIRIPVSGIALSVLRGRWPQLDPDRHIFFHTRTSLTKLFTAAKFESVSYEFDSNSFQFPRFTSSAILEKALSVSLEAPVSRLLNSLGAGDQICAVFRKCIDNSGHGSTR
ncbi:MAG: bifunctional glycosyltransferase/class I SAM-dependent methyltransferase [Acidimicrobiales bacterium]